MSWAGEKGAPGPAGIERIAVVFPSYGRMDVLERALHSQYKYRDLFGEHRVYVCLQAYSDAEKDALKARFPWVRTVESAEPLGPGGGRALAMNLVLSEGLCDVTYMCDDDMTFSERSTIMDAASVMLAYPYVGVVQIAWDHPNLKMQDKAVSVANLGGGFIYRTDLIRRIGNWKSGEYLDDYEFTTRAFINGYNNWRTTRALSIHMWEGHGGLLKHYETAVAKSVFNAEWLKFIPKSVTFSRKGQNKDYLPNWVSCLTKDARDLHVKMRKELVGGTR